MTTPRGRPSKSAEVGAPKTFAQGDPSSVQSFQPDWSLQILVDLKRDVGVLIERVEGMRRDVDGLSNKVDAMDSRVGGINTKLAWLAGICAGITGVVLIVWAVLTQVPWDKVAPAKAAATIEQPKTVATKEK
jgi:hypothetical protein